jgi:ketosteroid isomerase-like protein
MAAREPASAEVADRVETVRQVFDAFGRRDIERVLTFMHPRVRLWSVTAAVTRQGRPYVGHDGIREYARDVDRVWRELELLPIDFQVLGQAILSVGEVRARGGAGELRQQTVWTWRFSDGLVVECRVDSDVRAAREALGESSAVDDLLRAYISAFNRRDLQAMTALTDPAFVNQPWSVSQTTRKYLGHQGLRDWIRHVDALHGGHTVEPREVRKLEDTQWALLGRLLVDDEAVSPFACLFGVSRGLIADAREYLTEESLLVELGYLPQPPAHGSS